MGVTNSKAKKRIIRIKKNNPLKSKGVDTLKYCGTIQLKEDALSIQKKLRESGNKFFLDTNIILYTLNGDKIIASYLFEKILYTSIISAIELFSFPAITLNRETGIKRFLNEFKIIPLDQAVKEIAISLTRKYSLKIPDSIIAATAINIEMPWLLPTKTLN